MTFITHRVRSSSRDKVGKMCLFDVQAHTDLTHQVHYRIRNRSGFDVFSTRGTAVSRISSVSMSRCVQRTRFVKSLDSAQDVSKGASRYEERWRCD